MKTTATIATLLLTLLLLHLHPTAASTSGSGLITVEDYPVFGPKAPDNPPFCGMPYDSLNLNRITAVQSLTLSECGTCLEVCGSAGCADVLAVDRGGIGLDLSTGISGEVIGNTNGRGKAKWKPVAKSKCKGIWDGRMSGKKREVEVMNEKKGRASPLQQPPAIEAKGLVPVINPTPAMPISIPPPSPSTLPAETSPSLSSILTILSSNSTATNATFPTVTIITTVFPPTPTPTPPTTTSSRTTTAPFDAVTYAYTNGGSGSMVAGGKLVWEGWWWWWVVGFVVVGIMEGGWLRGLILSQGTDPFI